MIRLKSLSKIGEEVASFVKLAGKKSGLSSVLNTVPVKSDFRGLSLAPLKSESLFTTAKAAKVEKFNSQSEKLKAFYNSKGYSYRLPNEEWSDKKIVDTLKLLGNDLDKLVETKKLDKKTLRKAINKLVPESKGKIVVKDFADLEATLRAEGKSEEVIQRYLKVSGAITSSSSKKSTIFIKFENLNEDKIGPALIKTDVEHELKHALSAVFQNANSTDLYKNKLYKCAGQTPVFNNIFSVFEAEYKRPVGRKVDELSQQNMLNLLGFGSTKELHNSFETTIGKLINEEKSAGVLNLGSEKNSWKQFFSYLKNSAKDEKEALKSTYRYRELWGKHNVPTNAELQPLVYAEMEKFFAQKRIQINKQIPTS